MLLQLGKIIDNPTLTKYADDKYSTFYMNGEIESTMPKFIAYCGLSTAIFFSTVLLTQQDANAQSFRILRKARPQPCYPQNSVSSSVTDVTSQPQTYCLDSTSQQTVAVSETSQTLTQSFPFGFREETRTRTVTKYRTEQRTKTVRDSNGNVVTQTYSVQVPVRETIEEVVKVARTQTDVLRDTDAAVAQLTRNVDEIQKKLLKIQKEDDPDILPTLQTLEELIKKIKDKSDK